MGQTKQELQREVDDNALIEKAKGIFSMKWVERLVFWLLVTVAATILGVIVKSYVIPFFFIKQ